jgi:hypothetical protein
MNGEQLAMNEAPVNQPDVALIEMESNSLASPQFDETAIAEAQPVEPLPPERLGLSALAAQPFVIVIAFGLLFVFVVLLSALVHSPEQVKADEALTTTESRSEPPKSMTTESATGVVPVPVIDIDSAGDKIETFLRSRKSARSRHRTNRSDQSGRPVARKVGEIRYGRGSDYR